MVRYARARSTSFAGIVPLAAATGNCTPDAATNFIDEIVFAKLKLLGIPPVGDCDDATFVRRAALDIAGRLPSAAEAQAFLADASPSKRDAWIDKLLASADYGDFFATKWSALLRNQRGNDRQARGTFAFHDWIRESLRQNKPYDQFVRELIGASGDIAHNPAVVWYRTVASSNQQLEDTAQLFLGQRIQCARCHHHPYEKWAQRDYYGFAAFFSQVARKKGSLELRLDEPRVFHQRAARPGPTIPAPALRCGRPSLEWREPPLADSRRRRPARGVGRLDGESRESLFRPLAGQPLLEALFRPRAGRAGRRHAGHQSAHESRVARPTGSIVRRKPF